MSRSSSRTPGSSDFGGPLVPPLEPGDRLTRAEFERRYEAMPEVRKAELIEGVVYLPAAVRAHRHDRPQTHLLTWFGCYEAATPHMFVADNASVRLDLDNMPQPDALLLIEPGFGGQATISDDDYVENAPEAAALIDGKLAQVLAVLDRGIKSPEHAEFVAKLTGR